MATSTEMADGWIEAWRRMDMGWLRQHLAADFTHESPFGKLEGRDDYLAAVEPMARKSVAELTRLETVGAGERAVVRYENKTPNGVIEGCDWIVIEGEQIKTIRSYYDPTKLREVFSASDRDQLSGDAS